MDKLNNFDKTRTPFKVPENYFENFNNSIMGKLPVKEGNLKNTRIVPLWKKVLPWAVAAAMFCGVLFTTGILKDKTNNPNTALTSSSVEEDYYQFLKNEVVKSQYKEMIDNSY